MTKVKICGLSTPEAVTTAVEAGADYIGFVFAKSKRQVSLEQAHELAKGVTGQTKIVGVFVSPSLEELEESGTIFVFPMKKDTYLWHRDSEFAVRQKIEETLQKYHSEHPYRYGMKKAEIHNTFLKKIKPNIFDAYIERMTGENVYGRREEYLSLPGYEVPKDAMYLQTEKLIEDTFEKAGYDFVRVSEIDFGKIPRQTAEDVVLMMIDEGKVIRINEEMFTMKHLMDEAKEKIQNHLKEENLITIAQVRDMFSTSRKSAKPILEYMDSIKVTKKTGGESERVAYL